MSSTMSTATIGVLGQSFAAYGLPAQVVTDNRTQFTSDEFTAFMKTWRNVVELIVAQQGYYKPERFGPWTIFSW